MCLWTRKNRLNFGSHPHLNLDWILQHFATIWSICLSKNWSGLCENFIIDASLDREVSVKCWKSFASGPDSPWRWSALYECYCFHCVLSLPCITCKDEARRGIPGCKQSVLFLHWDRLVSS